MAGGGDSERFGRRVDVVPGALPARAEIDDGHADAVVGDGGAERDAGGVVGAGDAQARQSAARLDRQNFADIADRVR